MIEFRRSIFISLLYFSTVFIQFESGGSPFRFVRFSFSLFIFCCCRIVESFPSKTVAVFFRPRRLTRHGRFPFDVGASIYISGRASFLFCFFFVSALPDVVFSTVVSISFHLDVENFLATFMAIDFVDVGGARVVSTGNYWVLPSFTRFVRSLPSFTEFTLVLPSCTGFLWVTTGFT